MVDFLSFSYFMGLNEINHVIENILEFKDELDSVTVFSEGFILMLNATLLFAISDRELCTQCVYCFH